MALGRLVRSVQAMSLRLPVMLVAGLVAVLVVVSPAFASLGDEISAGQALAAQVRSGDTSCDAPSDAQFGHIGEYVMDRMAGSRAAHDAMNERMTRAIGTENADRMHELIGRRFAGCASGAAEGVPMSPEMMGSSDDGGGWGMMGGSGWGWMHNGSWQHMSQPQWRQLAGTMMGSRYTSEQDGWRTAAVISAVVALVLLGALLAVLVVRRPWRRRPPTAPSAA